jgi:hypothetical protein
VQRIERAIAGVTEEQPASETVKALAETYRQAGRLGQAKASAASWILDSSVQLMAGAVNSLLRCRCPLALYGGFRLGPAENQKQVAKQPSLLTSAVPTISADRLAHMSSPEALAVVQAAISLSRTHRHAPQLDVLDLVMKGHIDQVIDFCDLTATQGSLAAPAMPFGQLLAAAFDEAMTPTEWKAFTDETADTALRDGCLEIWRAYVIRRFEARYGVVVRGLPQHLARGVQSG